MYGLDLSNYQWAIDLHQCKDQFAFGIVKATEGQSMVDKSFEKHMQNLWLMDKCLGCYHYARPDLHTNIEEMKKEAEHFCSTVQKWVGKALFFLDWEAKNKENLELAKCWLETVHDITGVKPLIYVTSSFYAAHKMDEVFNTYEMWLAQCPSYTKGYTVGQLIATEPPYSCQIWQYTHSGVFGNYNAPVDLDFTTMQAEEWIKKARPNRQEILSDDMQWAISENLILGYYDGTYRPDNYVTRNQLAVILHRLYDLLT